MANKSVNLVLLVDDNDTDNFISKRIIEITKFAERVIVKNSGKSALEYLESVQNEGAELPDVIFLDINMPIVDGFVFLFEFEMFAETVKNKCKIIILSSSNNKREILLGPIPFFNTAGLICCSFCYLVISADLKWSVIDGNRSKPLSFTFSQFMRSNSMGSYRNNRVEPFWNPNLYRLYLLS